MKCQRCKADNPEFSLWCVFCGEHIGQSSEFTWDPQKETWEHQGEKANPDAKFVCKHCGVKTQRRWIYCNRCGLKWNTSPHDVKYYWFNQRFIAKLEDGAFWFRRDKEKHIWIQKPGLWGVYFDAGNDVIKIRGYDEETEAIISYLAIYKD